MTTFLFVRHGESLANRHEIFCGQSDYDLSEKGYAQAAVTAKYIAENYQVACVYASDLTRAFHTGEAIAEAAGCPVVADPALREIHCGEWEEAPFGEMLTRWPDSYPAWLHDIGNVQCPGGETVPDVLARVLPALEVLALRHENDAIAIATHGTVIRALMCVLGGKPLSEMKNIPWNSNASVTEFFYEDGAWRIGRVNLDGHLGDLSTRLPDTV
ncbi:MAG: histidine phosphatase family protein [Clostridia bacterium]|nr:histidine phosphatase family protein [Clostridia bacterium]